MDNNVMNDAEFGKRICHCVNADECFLLLKEDLSLEQYETALALASVCIIGTKGKLYHGVSRLIENFPRNFDGIALYGKRRPGNKPLTDDEREANIVKAREVKRLIGSGMFQKDACKKVGMSESNYKKYRQLIKSD